LSAFKVETVVEGLEVPWSIAWRPDGSMLVTERPGRVRVVANGKLQPDPILVLSDVRNASESGLMGLCLHPDYARNKFVYLSYAYGGRGGSGGNAPENRPTNLHGVRVVRFVDHGDKLLQDKIIVDDIPGAPNHAGCRIKFGPDRKLYITTGDATDWQNGQRMNTLAGKILRVNDDGSIPADNPFFGKPGVRGEIWAYGSRNAQGLDWHPETQMLVETEHGPSGFEGLGGGGDEVNIVAKGDNLGWPTIHHRQTQTGMVSPLIEYSPAIAPASGMFYSGKEFPEFRGNYFFGALRGEALYRVVLDGRSVTKQEKIVTGLGRIRDVAQGPDGYIYFSTSNRDGRGRAAASDDRILRLVPAK
jgi:glucose/arabinose dehydrogenase